jgi:hypothetical protein
LAARAIKQMNLSLWQRVDWITHQPADVANLWIDRAVGGAVAEGDISLLVHCSAAHPTMDKVRLVGALLENSDRAGRCIAKLEPPRRRYSA